MASLKPHKFTQNGKVEYANLPDVYDNGAEYTIGSAIGISKLTANDEIPAGTNTVEVGSGIKNGIFVRMRVSYNDVTDTNKRKSAMIVCPMERASGAIAGLRAKKYKGSDVASAAVPRRRRLG